jgi:integrase
LIFVEKKHEYGWTYPTSSIDSNDWQPFYCYPLTTPGSIGFKMKLTIKAIDAIKPDGRDHVEWDDEVPRYGLRVKPSGVMSFVIQYRTAQGRPRKITIGRYGPWAPGQARTEAKRLLRLVDQGEDPAEAAAKEKEAITVATLCDEYLSAAEAGLIKGRNEQPKRASTIRQDKPRISAHFKPLIGNKLIRDFTRADARQFYEDVARGRHAKRNGKSVIKGGQSAARRCVGLGGGMFTYAVRLGYREEGPNPFANLGIPGDRKRQFRLEPDGWRALGNVIAAAKEQGVPWQTTEIAMLLALTGCRLREISDLQWAEIDFAAHCFRFDPDRVKTAPLRHVGREAVALLKTLKQLNREPDSAFVFPMRRKSGRDLPYTGFQLAFRQINPSFSAHLIRHAYAGTAEASCGLHESTVGALLGHSKRSGNMTAGYILKPDALLLAAADKVSRFIWQAMTGEIATAHIFHLASRSSNSSSEM